MAPLLPTTATRCNTDLAGAAPQKTEAWKYGVGAGVIAGVVMYCLANMVDAAPVSLVAAQAVRPRPVYHSIPTTSSTRTQGTVLPAYMGMSQPSVQVAGSSVEGYIPEQHGLRVTKSNGSMVGSLLVVLIGGATAAVAFAWRKMSRQTIAMAATSGDLDTAPKQAAYGIGLQLGADIASQPFEGLELEAVIAGMTDGFNGNPPQVPQDVLRDAFDVVQKQMKASEEAKFAANRDAGIAFLRENMERDEVTELESGLQYEVLEAGSGEKPTLSSTVKTHYHGTLLDGTVFDSSYERGAPAEFPVSRVIKGWTEALQLMEVGAKWKLYVPQYLAYGEKGAGGDIPPYSTLIFTVELLEITS